MRSRRQRRAIAGWLGLLALAIQALIPLLVAGEITLAAASGKHSVFELCAFGHVHAAGHEADGAPGKPGGHDEDGCALCPICVALHASPVFTAPGIAFLPAPVVHEIAIALPQTRAAPRLAALTPYRSRAPPFG